MTRTRDRKLRVDRLYKAVRDARPELYQKAIRAADAVSIQHNLSTQVAAAIELTMMGLVADLAEIPTHEPL